MLFSVHTHSLFPGRLPAELVLASSSFSALFNFSNDFSLEYIITTAPQNFSFSWYSQIRAEILFPYCGYGGALLALEGCTGIFSFAGLRGV